MLRRLRIYFTGFGIGLIAVYFMFRNSEERNLDIWTPEQRILEDIRNDSVFQNSDRLACYVDCLSLTEEELKTLWSKSEVKSVNPGGNPYVYKLTCTAGQSEFELELEWNKGSKRYLKYIKNQNPDLNCTCE